MNATKWCKVFREEEGVCGGWRVGGVGGEEGDLSWTILEGTKEGSYGEYMGGRITL